MEFSAVAAKKLDIRYFLKSMQTDPFEIDKFLIRFITEIGFKPRISDFWLGLGTCSQFIWTQLLERRGSFTLYKKTHFIKIIKDYNLYILKYIEYFYILS